MKTVSLDRDQRKKTRTNYLVIIMAITPLLSFSWWIGNMIDPLTDYDLFPFIAHEQKLQWYFHYSGYYLTIVAYSFVIWKLCQRFMSRNISLYAKCIYIFCLFRMFEYWLFRFNVPILSISVSLTIIGLIIYRLWLQR